MPLGSLLVIVLCFKQSLLRSLLCQLLIVWKFIQYGNPMKEFIYSKLPQGIFVFVLEFQQNMKQGTNNDHTRNGQ